MKRITILIVGILLTGITQADSKQVKVADEFYQASNWSKAATAYRNLTESTPDNMQYWQRLAVAYLNLKQYALAIDAYEGALDRADQTQRNPILFGMARAEAGLESLSGVVKRLGAIADAGGTPFQAVMNTPELAKYQGQATFDAVLNRLKPCQTDQHRAFDFWLGQWKVTSPARSGWQASSSITLGNGGCTIHEAYSTPGGYAGTSVNFYDVQKGQWHQTWMDNQGGPLYMDGEPIENGMQLGDGSNRITWTREANGQVRQHWEVTSDNGKTYTTAFDGYYEKI